eukprot:765110-Hanusia_phi.AAC.11
MQLRTNSISSAPATAAVTTAAALALSSLDHLMPPVVLSGRTQARSFDTLICSPLLLLGPARLG